MHPRWYPMALTSVFTDARRLQRRLDHTGLLAVLSPTAQLNHNLKGRRGNPPGPENPDMLQLASQYH